MTRLNCQAQDMTACMVGVSSQRREALDRQKQAAGRRAHGAGQFVDYFLRMM